MQRIAIGFRIDRDCRYAHATRRFDDSAGDFATIGNQDSLEHVTMDPARRVFAAALPRKCLCIEELRRLQFLVKINRRGHRPSR
jgi:hypothetical protein